MRRLTLIFGIFLTLTAGVWSSALAASAWCMHEASAPSAPDEHDCCRAKIGESNEHHSESQGTSHDASHEKSTTRNQAHESHAGMNCGDVVDSSTHETPAVALSQGGLSCGECCAGGSGRTPTTAVVIVPEQHKVKRDAASDSAGTRDLFAPASARVSHFAPSQHAPPAPPERRHALIGVFLI
jgi:hypothetical protein